MYNTIYDLLVAFKERATALLEDEETMATGLGAIGLCTVAYDDFFNRDERYILDRILKQNLPEEKYYILIPGKKYNKILGFLKIQNKKDFNLCWSRGDKDSRLAFVDELLEKYKNV